MFVLVIRRSDDEVLVSYKKESPATASLVSRQNRGQRGSLLPSALLIVHQISTAQVMDRENRKYKGYQADSC